MKDKLKRIEKPISVVLCMVLAVFCVYHSNGEIGGEFVVGGLMRLLV